MFNENVFFVGRGEMDGKMVPGMFMPRQHSRIYGSEYCYSIKLYVIDRKNMKVHHLEEFEVLTVRPATAKLIENDNN